MRLLSITTADYESFESGILEKFLQSCTMNDVEVFLVLRDFPTEEKLDFPGVVHSLYVPQMSLSQARNEALEFIQKSRFNIFEFEYLMFLDDDCEVTPSINLLRDRSSHSKISIGSYGPTIAELHCDFRAVTEKGEGINSTINRVASCTLYFRPEVIKSVGAFFTTIGVPNRPFSKGEDTEFFLRALELGFDYEIDPSIFVIHPYKEGSREDSILSDCLLSLCYVSLLGYKRLIKITAKSFYFTLIGKLHLRDFLKIFSARSELIKFRSRRSLDSL